MVRITGVEPAHLSILEPKSSVASNYTISAEEDEFSNKLLQSVYPITHKSSS